MARYNLFIAVHVLEVADCTFRIEDRPPRSPFTYSVYFVRDQATVIIEPGPAVMIPSIQEALRQLSLSHIDYIVPTHIHVDHGGAIGLLGGMFPESQIVLNERGARHAIDPERLIRSTRMSFGEGFESVFGPITPVSPSRIMTVRDGDKLAVGARDILVIETPGHAPHHISLLDTSTGALFPGEALGLMYRQGLPPFPSVTMPNFDPEVYLKDMLRLRDTGPKTLFYSHLGMSREPDKAIDAAMENTIAFGRIVQEAMAGETTDERVIDRVGEEIQKRFGFRLDDYELMSNTRAFMDYYQRRSTGVSPVPQARAQPEQPGYPRSLKD